MAISQSTEIKIIKMVITEKAYCIIKFKRLVIIFTIVRIFAKFTLILLKS